jgi:hypothetical protein
MAINKLFGFDATYYYTIPRKYVLKGTFLSFLHDPIYTMLGMMLGLWLSRTVLHRKTVDSPIWEISLSSKKDLVFFGIFL